MRDTTMLDTRYRKRCQGKCRHSTGRSTKIQPETLAIGMRDRAGWSCKVHGAAMVCGRVLVQRAGTYRELVLEDTLVQDRHSYDGGLAGLLAGGVCHRGVSCSASIPTKHPAPVYIGCLFPP